VAKLTALPAYDPSTLPILLAKGKSINTPGVLNFAHLVFIFEVEKWEYRSSSLEVMELFKTDEHRYLVIGGTAKQWKDTIIEECNSAATDPERADLFFLCYEYLGKTALKDMFAGYTVRGKRLSA
jgi:hypothetical protein